MSRKASQSANSRDATTNQKSNEPVELASGRAQSQLKKVTRRSSRPIINWFQRKLAGTGRRHNAGLPNTAHGGIGKGRPAPGSSLRERVVSSPNPPPSLSHSNGAHSETLNPPRRKTISLDESVEYARSAEGDPERRWTATSTGLDSTWSPVEADDDASVRPIPPSIPPSPSPSPSRSSSSYLSGPRTFRSITASTKPTTLISVDLTPNVMAHIAQAPASSSNHLTRLSTHTRTSSNGVSGAHLGSATSITFSALPQSSPSSRPSSAQHVSNGTLSVQDHAHISGVQAPLHTTHHPRNNPRPSSPPLDNASILTLASSAFGLPGSRSGAGSLGWGSTAASALAGDSISHLDSISGDADGDNESILVDEERDLAASVRALRPRSSRRGSWDSEVSRWSARVGAGVPGTPSFVRDRSLWTANSMQTGGQFDGEVDVESAEDQEKDKDMDLVSAQQPRNGELVRPASGADPLDHKSSPVPSDEEKVQQDDVRPGNVPLVSLNGEARSPHEKLELPQSFTQSETPSVSS